MFITATGAGQDRQRSIIQSSGSRVQDGRQAQVRQRSVIQSRGKGSKGSKARVKTRRVRKRETGGKQNLRQNVG